MSPCWSKHDAPTSGCQDGLRDPERRPPALGRGALKGADVGRADVVPPARRWSRRNGPAPAQAEDSQPRSMRGVVAATQSPRFAYSAHAPAPQDHAPSWVVSFVVSFTWVNGGRPEVAGGRWRLTAAETATASSERVAELASAWRLSYSETSA